MKKSVPHINSHYWGYRELSQNELELVSGGDDGGCDRGDCGDSEGSGDSGSNGGYSDSETSTDLAMNLSNGRLSDNVVDLRGVDMGGWIDANGMCWAAGTPSATMYPDGANPRGTDGFGPQRGANEGIA